MSRAKFVRALTKQEEVEMARLIRKGDDARVVRRAQIVRLSAQGKKCGEIAELLGFSVPTIHRVIDNFGKEGISSFNSIGDRNKKCDFCAIEACLNCRDGAGF